MKNRTFLGVLCFLIVAACNTEPKAIAYGSEGCHFCSMTIVDTQHAAQFMTKKGRSYSFDATECMFNYLQDVAPETIALYRVNDYNNPGVFIDAKEATYLISKNIPSPMGGNLSAFTTKEAAEKMQQEHTGSVYSWKELQSKFNKG
ncbi:nitrous oxide reductase accessory protein NosL [Cellulophaga sp. E16_2]|uniref:Hypothetical lipoprotein n=1 Tax=Cellulophaga algicola (strain DSM 14237 / IC166 / ACAM 630) TaxID=688270 RepID=E6X4T8_CELAD|nr:MULTISPECIES: nitrous oxide reductase accessory protein NosL [Cellulophaga]ADV50430.1 hypothetical lipoprotein [Cellulophaga algicola DSM 14237]MBO0592833.1 nitrous oxide reductase accessory protein NosL [Cellulophaga sp. E16_2]